MTSASAHKRVLKYVSEMRAIVADYIDDDLNEDKHESLVERTGASTMARVYSPTHSGTLRFVKPGGKNEEQLLDVSKCYQMHTLNDDNVLVPNDCTEIDIWRSVTVLNPSVSKRSDNITPLAVAASLGRGRMVRLLLDFGHEVNIPALDGSTPLMEAILSGNATTEDKLDIIEQLINLGASPHCETKNGHTVVNIAVQAGDVAVAQVLVRAFEDLDWNKPSSRGNTPLMFAVHSNNKEMVLFLVKHGNLDLSIENKLHLTAMDVALKQNCSTQTMTGISLIAMMLSDKWKFYLEKRITYMVKMDQSKDKSVTCKLAFASCILATLYFSRFKAARKCLFDLKALDMIYRSSGWPEDANIGAKLFCWMIFTTQAFIDADNNILSKMQETQCCQVMIQHYHNELANGRKEIDNFYDMLICITTEDSAFLYKDITRRVEILRTIDKAPPLPRQQFIERFIPKVQSICSIFDLKEFGNEFEEPKAKALFTPHEISLVGRMNAAYTVFLHFMDRLRVHFRDMNAMELIAEEEQQKATRKRQNEKIKKKKEKKKQAKAAKLTKDECPEHAASSSDESVTVEVPEPVVITPKIANEQDCVVRKRRGASSSPKKKSAENVKTVVKCEVKLKKELSEIKNENKKDVNPVLSVSLPDQQIKPEKEHAKPKYEKVPQSTSVSEQSQEITQASEAKGGKKAMPSIQKQSAVVPSLTVHSRQFTREKHKHAGLAGDMLDVKQHDVELHKNAKEILRKTSPVVVEPSKHQQEKRPHQAKTFSPALTNGGTSYAKVAAPQNGADGQNSKAHETQSMDGLQIVKERTRTNLKSPRKPLNFPKVQPIGSDRKDLPLVYSIPACNDQELLFDNVSYIENASANIPMNENSTFENGSNAMDTEYEAQRQTLSTNDKTKYAKLDNLEDFYYTATFAESTMPVYPGEEKVKPLGNEDPLLLLARKESLTKLIQETQLHGQHLDENLKKIFACADLESNDRMEYFDTFASVTENWVMLPQQEMQNSADMLIPKLIPKTEEIVQTCSLVIEESEEIPDCMRYPYHLKDSVEDEEAFKVSYQPPQKQRSQINQEIPIKDHVRRVWSTPDNSARDLPGEVNLLPLRDVGIIGQRANQTLIKKLIASTTTSRTESMQTDCESVDSTITPAPSCCRISDGTHSISSRESDQNLSIPANWFQVAQEPPKFPVYMSENQMEYRNVFGPLVTPICLPSLSSNSRDFYWVSPCPFPSVLPLHQWTSQGLVSNRMQSFGIGSETTSKLSPVVKPPELSDYNQSCSSSGCYLPDFEASESTSSLFPKRGVIGPQFVVNWIPNSKRWETLLTCLTKVPQELIVSKDLINFCCNPKFIISKGMRGCVTIGIQDDGVEVAVRGVPKVFYDVIQSDMYKMAQLQFKSPFLLLARDVMLGDDIVFMTSFLCDYNLEEFIVQLVTYGRLVDHYRRLSSELMEGLRALHACNILHMNLKPRNVLVDCKGMLHLADFGLSVNLQEKPWFAGSVDPVSSDWFAPEMLQKVFTYTPMTDVFVAGMMICYIASGGRHPYGKDPAYCELAIREGRPPMVECPDDLLADLMLSMLSPYPENRLPADIITRHPFFWSDRKKIEFLLAVGQDPDIISNEYSSVVNYIESEMFYDHPTALASRMDKDLVNQFGWDQMNLNCTKDVLTIIIPQFLDHFQELPEDIKKKVSDPGKYILMRMPHLFSAVFEAVLSAQWMGKKTLRDFFGSPADAAMEFVKRYVALKK